MLQLQKALEQQPNTNNAGAFSNVILPSNNDPKDQDGIMLDVLKGISVGSENYDDDSTSKDDKQLNSRVKRDSTRVYHNSNGDEVGRHVRMDYGGAGELGIDVGAYSSTNSRGTHVKAGAGVAVSYGKKDAPLHVSGGSRVYSEAGSSSNPDYVGASAGADFGEARAGPFAV